MKKGDKIPVNIAGDVVAQATIESVDETARTVTMVVPATRVVMALRVELDTTPPAVEDKEVQTIITGVDRVDADGNVIAGASVDAPGGIASASVGETTNTSQTGTNEGTPTGTATQTQLVAPVVPPVVVNPPEVTPKVDQ